MSWSIQSGRIAFDVEHIRIRNENTGHQLSLATFISLLESSPEFSSWWTSILASVPFPAYRWELPPFSNATSNRPFECIVASRPSLHAADEDRDTFSTHFRQASGGQAISFPSLGRDCILIVPTPQTPNAVYSHLAVFVRSAKTEQCNAVWKLTGEKMREQCGNEPRWLNTAGAGVAWLHIRIDSTPKYYSWAAYRSRDW